MAASNTLGSVVDGVKGYRGFDNFKYTDTGAIILMVVGALGFITALVGIAAWIHYSWRRKTNSKNLTGMDVTRKILDQADMKDTTLINSMWYSKFWNHNKRKNTYRLRPWTANRQSLWTIMEATQQAYATTIRKNQPSVFWLIFRIPSLIRVVAVIAALAAIYFLMKADSPTWLIVTAGVGIAGIPMLVSNCWGLYLLEKNVLSVISVLDLNEEETKSIRTIFRIRLLLTIIVTILDLIRIVVQILEGINKAKSTNK